MERKDFSESNYEMVFRQFQEWFVKDDQEAAAKKLDLTIDETYLYVPFFQELCLADRKSGSITKENGQELSVFDRLTIMHHLHYYQPYAQESTKMVPYREIKEAAVFEKAYRKASIEPLIRVFSGACEKFLAAGLSLGGKQESFGDASITFQAFPKIRLTYIFWDKDEEFPASANILFSDKISQWIHSESVPTLAQIGTEKLIQAAKKAETF